MASAIIANVGTIADPSGCAWQSHLLHDGTRWWCFYMDSTDATKLRSKYSSDLSSWSAGATLTDSYGILSGRDMYFGTKTISGTIVVHCGYNSNISTRTSKRVRGTISGTTLTWGTPTAVDTGYTSLIDPAGGSVAFGSDDVVFMASAALEHTYGLGGLVSDADTGGSAPSTWTQSMWKSTTAYYNRGQIVLPLASGAAICIGEEAGAAQPTSMKEVFWTKYTGTWSAGGSIFSALGAAVDPNNFGAVKVSNTDIHCVLRTGSNTYSHARFDGSSWSAGHSITNQNSLAGGGIFLASDGANVWLFVIDTDGANTIRYCEWTGSSWGSWTALETTTKTRTFISGYPVAVGGVVAALWTEDHGDGTYDLVVEGLGGGGGGASAVPVIMNSYRQRWS